MTQYNPFNPFAAPFNAPAFQQPNMTPAAPAQPTLPAQQVLQVNGQASIAALRMAPNSSVIAMDTTAPLVWICTSDGIGTVTAKAFDITPHEERPPVDVASIEQRLAAVEKQIKEAFSNDKPDARPVEHKQTGKRSAEDRAD